VIAARGAEKRALRSVRALAAAYPLAPGYTTEVGPAESEQAGVVRAAAAGLALAVALIFCILVFHFQSASLALAVMLQIPLSFLLPALLLHLLRLPLGTSTFAGLILTAGLAVNNAIIVLEGSRARSRRPLAAALARKAPVVASASLTTALAAVPLLFAGLSAAPCGAGVLAPLSLTLAAGVLGSALALPLGLAVAARH